MNKTRVVKQATSLKEVLEILEATKFPELTWVGKHYSKQALIRDLKAVEEKTNDNSNQSRICSGKFSQ